jgi:hypothetical protein
MQKTLIYPLILKTCEPQVIFEVRVDLGNMKTIYNLNDPCRYTWQHIFDSAWLPEKHDSRGKLIHLEENCIKNPAKIEIVDYYIGYKDSQFFKT